MLIIIWWSPEMRNFSSPFYGWPPKKKYTKGAQKRVSLDIKHVFYKLNPEIQQSPNWQSTKSNLSK